MKPCTLLLALLSPVMAMSDPTPIPLPPRAKQVPHAQTWHGRRYEDPYFWMRQKDHPDVLAYLQAENAYTAACTEALKPLQETLYREMLGRIKQTDLGVPVYDRGYHYYSRTEEGKQYGIQCRKKGSLDAPEEVLLDLNALGKGHAFIAMGDRDISPSGQLMAYTTDTTGFRQYRLQVKDLCTGRLLPDTAERVTSLAWAGDDRTLFYVTEDPVTKRSDQLWRLELGGKPERVHAEKDALFALDLGTTKDRRYLVLNMAVWREGGDPVAEF